MSSVVLLVSKMCPQVHQGNKLIIKWLIITIFRFLTLPVETLRPPTQNGLAPKSFKKWLS